MKRSLVVLAVFSALLGASSLLVLEPDAPTLDPLPPVPARSHQPELSRPASAAAEPSRSTPQAATEPEPSAGSPASNEVGPALMERLGTRLAQQGSDPEWSAAAEQRARDHLGTIDGVEPVEVTCGAALCRLEFEVVAEGQEAISKAEAAIPWHAPSIMAMMDLDETPVAIVYLAREGHTLSEG